MTPFDAIPPLPAHLEQMRQKLVNGEAQLFDVREQDEWDEGHLAGVELVSLSMLQGGEGVPARVNNSKETYLHCRSGVRVHAAAPILRSLGFTQVIPLSEGFERLVSLGFKADFPTLRPHDS